MGKVHNIRLLILPVFFQLSVVLAMLGGNRGYLYIPFLCVFLYAILKRGSFLKKINRKEMYFFIIYFITIFFGLGVNFFRQPVVIFYFFLGIAVWIAAFLFTRNLKEYYKSSKITLLLYQIIFISAGVLKGFNNFPAVVPYEDMIPGSSANVITSFAILLQINYVIINYIVNKKTSLLTSLLTLIIAFIGYGRGSILSAMLIVVICIFTSLGLQRKFKAIISVFFILIITSFVINNYWEEINFFFTYKTKFSAGLVDDSRSLIIKTYLSLLDLPSFFAGVDYTGTLIDTQFGGNPHNTFLRAHRIFGLFYLLFIIFAPIVIILNNTKKMEILLYLSLIGVLYFRMFSEPIISPTIFDFYYFSFCLILLIKKNTYFDSNKLNKIYEKRISNLH